TGPKRPALSSYSDTQPPHFALGGAVPSPSIKRIGFHHLDHRRRANRAARPGIIFVLPLAEDELLGCCKASDAPSPPLPSGSALFCRSAADSHSFQQTARSTAVQIPMRSPETAPAPMKGRGQ